MRKFNITVNGKTYEVDVEEVGGASTAAYTAPAAAAPVQAAPAAAPAPSAPAPKPAAASTGAGTPVKAPMPGTIVSIKVNVGDTVNKGTLVAVLEAMKMENDIVAPCDGKITSIVVNKGDTVESADTLATIQ